MNLLQRWCLFILTALINAELFEISDPRFWMIMVFQVIMCNPLLENKTDSK